jgi:hypothetical protein
MRGFPVFQFKARTFMHTYIIDKERSFSCALSSFKDGKPVLIPAKIAPAPVQKH